MLNICAMLAAIFEANLGDTVAALSLMEEYINSLTDNIKEVLQKVAGYVLGEKKGENKLWVTQMTSWTQEGIQERQ